MTVIILSLLAVVSSVGGTPSFAQKPAGNPARINACTILTRDVAAKATTAASKTVLKSTPEERPVGLNGSYCDYGGIGLQIDPFAGADRIRQSPEKNWVPVSGVGDTAYFYNVRDFFAELIVWSGSHHFAIQMEVPAGGTAEQLKPNTIQLANLIIPKLK
jgi:hypothetical protein